MSITRVPSLLEQSIKSNTGGTNPSVRTNLEVYSKLEVDGQISAIDLSPYALTSTIASISGALNSDINLVEVDIANLESDVQDISGNLATLTANLSGDIYDLDLSLTSSIATLFNNTSTSAISGSYAIPAQAAGFITVSISGSPYKIAYFN